MKWTLPLVLSLILSTGCPPRPHHAPRRATPAADHLQGDWHVVSTLHVRDGVTGPSRHLLELARRLRDVLEGKLDVPGIPKLLTSLAGALVAQQLKGLVPSWAADLLKRLAKLDDALNDIRVESIETLRATGAHRYEGSSRWLRVTVRLQSTSVSKPPSDIPGLGRLTPSSYTARERDGRLHVTGLAVNHRLGKVVRWAVDALLGAVTCSTKEIPCLKTVQQLVGALIPCDKLADRVAKAAPALGPFKGLVTAACQSQKQRLVAEVGRQLDTIDLKLTFARLEGTGRVDGERLVGGRWQGKLGKAYGQGAFTGSFTGKRAGK